MLRGLLLIPVAGLMVLLGACTQGSVDPDAVTYGLVAQNDSGIGGSVTFERVSATETRVTIDVDGTAAGETYPAHIHVGDVGSGGDIYVSLAPVPGDSGTSVITVTQTDAGTPVDYDHLVGFDGYVNVHDPDDASIIVAAGETGEGATPIVTDP